MKASSILFLGILGTQILAAHATEGKDTAIEQLDPYKTSELNGFGIYQHQVRGRIPKGFYNIEVYDVDREHLILRNLEENEPIYEGSPFWFNMQGRSKYYLLKKDDRYSDIEFDFDYYWFALEYSESKIEKSKKIPDVSFIYDSKRYDASKIKYKVHVTDFRFLTDEEKIEHWVFASKCSTDECTGAKSWSQDFIDLISKDVRTSEIF